MQLDEHRLQTRALEQLRIGGERVGIHAELLQALALLLDTDAALRERPRSRAEDRPLLNVAAVSGDERDRDPE